MDSFEEKDIYVEQADLTDRCRHCIKRGPRKGEQCKNVAEMHGFCRRCLSMSCVRNTIAEDLAAVGPKSATKR